ncbi:single-stranded DNA-binding protein [Nocardioides gansuensis]|uniref:Single-stranded DNA-binding protein n=1 Tax=Nocardioides gansuensis TaxID=2138300 RepID=A0A2T8F542_9ACTN|nr:single-stranded DNA-binding protein [Nocardioides gansuensis]PVG80827.1 single-stranded DNA-binding protein [Nocardioides gansuensis]
MSAREKDAAPDELVPVNEVRLVGRLTAAPAQVELPSGDHLTTFRVVVDRPPGTSRQRVDTLECAVWSARVRRTVARWGPGDVVEVSGAIRRRFFTAGAGKASRVEVEVAGARVIRRARSA